MSRNQPDSAVVIPARNEAARIVTCLDALGRQAKGRLVVFVVVNNSDDGTAALARDACRTLDLPAEILDIQLDTGLGVGSVRRMGAQAALAAMPDLRHILTTDADSIPDPDWLERNLVHLRDVDAVCGNIGPIKAESHLIQGMDWKLAELEGRYRVLVMEFFKLCMGTNLHHGEASGASLAMKASAYKAVGGFRDVRTSEDRDIVRRLKASGHTVMHADDVWVRASLRLNGRAPGGMSDALKARVGGGSYVIDEALPPAKWLSERQHDLPVWPHDGTGYDAIDVSTLPAEIAQLERLIEAIQPTSMLDGPLHAHTPEHAPLSS